ncbi:MAG: 23S rRNA (adenine(2503)-C(2))-methyltransferase RlmN [Endomicrobium sp.]|jgi:23S rRNA (adenine2503-C2)-methyltransferase|nr:23S rRNA (adenine(2503)-C(2))-methyltransferase RlmN [Endomicrobium sp.]
MKTILDLLDSELYDFLNKKIKQKYRFNQIINWIYKKKIKSFSECTNLPKNIIKELSTKYKLRTLRIIQKKKSITNETIKYIFQTIDNNNIFAVLLKKAGKNKLCISSQIGCPIKCDFCSSGKVKFVRNLTKGEILEQILQVENDIKGNIAGVLFMGMGEPMLNFNNIVSVITALLDKNKFKIGKKHITISTIGIVPAIKNLAKINFGIRMALSIHAPYDFQRDKLGCNNFIKFSIADIMNAGKYYIDKTNSSLTIEYVLLKGINDSTKMAHKFARLIRQHKLVRYNVNVNLIPYNYTYNTSYRRSTDISIHKFKTVLYLNGIISISRKIKGEDINAACGQLGCY